jgi:hypothetical protein
MFALQKRISIGANWEPFSAKVVASDVINDVAILKTDESPFGDAPQFAPMEIGNAELTAHLQSQRSTPIFQSRVSKPSWQGIR